MYKHRLRHITDDIKDMNRRNFDHFKLGSIHFNGLRFNFFVISENDVSSTQADLSKSEDAHIERNSF